MKYKLIYFLLFSVILSVCSCNREEEKSYQRIFNAKYGIIQTGIQENVTRLDIYDKNCKLLGSKEYNICGVGRFGYGNPQSLNGVLYEIAVGNDYEKNLGVVIGFNLYTGESKEYKFNRINLLDLQVTDKYIYTISNANGKTYIDRYCFETQNIDSFCWDKELMTDFAVSDTGNVFFITPKGCIYFLKFDEKKAISIGQVKKDTDVSHLHAVGEKLYISLFSEKIMIVDVLAKKITTLDLELECGGQISDDGEYLYVASADPVNSLEDGFIVKLDMDTNEIICKWYFNCDIYYFVVGKGDVTVLSYNKSELRRYLVKNSRLGKIYSAKIDEKHSLSAMGCIENSR